MEKRYKCKGLADKLREKNSKKEIENSTSEENLSKTEPKKQDNLSVEKGKKNQVTNEAIDKEPIKKD